MRRDFAMRMGLAHCAGLLGLAIVGTLMSAEPDAGDLILLFVAGVGFSAFLFLPILVVTLVFVRGVLRHRVAFLLLGPALVTVLVSATVGAGTWKPIALQTGLSSLALFLLLRGKDDPERTAALSRAPSTV